MVTQVHVTLRPVSRENKDRLIQQVNKSVFLKLLLTPQVEPLCKPTHLSWGYNIQPNCEFAAPFIQAVLHEVTMISNRAGVHDSLVHQQFCSCKADRKLFT